jgi:hypothetical protein
LTTGSDRLQQEFALALRIKDARVLRIPAR